jgi:hypothetical protein
MQATRQVMDARPRLTCRVHYSRAAWVHGLHHATWVVPMLMLHHHGLQDSPWSGHHHDWASHRLHGAAMRMRCEAHGGRLPMHAHRCMAPWL